VKIAINHTRFSPTGGIEKYVYSLVEHLLNRGHEVHCFVRRWEPYPHPRLHFHAVPALPLGEGIKALSFAYASAFLLRRQRFDIVHAFSKTFEQDIYTDGSGCFDSYLPYLRSASVWRRLSTFRPLLPIAIRHLERRRFVGTVRQQVLAMSKMAEEQILERYGFPPDQIDVLYSGVDTHEFHPHASPSWRDDFRRGYKTKPTATVLLFVGNDYRRKGLATTIEALSRLKKSAPDSTVLWVLGKDRRAAQYEALASRKGVQARFLGTGKSPRDHLRAADVFVFPSLYDIFGNAALEALASGLPSIISTRAGVCELIRDGVDGLLLRDPEDPEELRGHIQTLLRPDTRRRIGAEAQKTASLHTLENHFEKLLEVYMGVLRARGKKDSPGGRSGE
jgi:UDP-glucose:(heptosyl)LPS alpha-1,3-glucosyltransferase